MTAAGPSPGRRARPGRPRRRRASPLAALAAWLLGPCAAPPPPPPPRPPRSRPAAPPRRPPPAPVELTVTGVRGTVERGGPGGAWRPLAAGDTAPRRTSRSAPAPRRAPTSPPATGGRLTIGERTQLAVRELTDQVHRYGLTEGLVNADYTGRRPVPAHRGRAASGRPVIEARAARVHVSASGLAFAVATETGGVSLTSAGASVTLGAGEAARARTGEAPDPPRAIPTSVLLKVAEASRAGRGCLDTTGEADPTASGDGGRRGGAGRARRPLPAPRAAGRAAGPVAVRAVLPDGRVTERRIPCRDRPRRPHRGPAGEVEECRPLSSSPSPWRRRSAPRRRPGAAAGPADPRPPATAPALPRRSRRGRARGARGERARLEPADPRAVRVTVRAPVGAAPGGEHRRGGRPPPPTAPGAGPPPGPRRPPASRRSRSSPRWPATTAASWRCRSSAAATRWCGPAPGAEVEVRIGERSFGPATAGRDGVALIPVEVPPGRGLGPPRRAAHPPRHPARHPRRAGRPGAPRRRPTGRGWCRSSWPPWSRTARRAGARRRPSRSRAGTLGRPEPAGPGLWRLDWRLPVGPVGQATARARLPRRAGRRAHPRAPGRRPGLRRAPPRAAAPPAPTTGRSRWPSPCATPPATRPTARWRSRPRPAEVSARAAPRPPGSYAATWTPPERLEGRAALLIAVRAGAAEAAGLRGAAPRRARPASALSASAEV